MKAQMKEAFTQAKIYLNQIEQEAWKNGFVRGWEAALHRCSQPTVEVPAQQPSEAAISAAMSEGNKLGIKSTDAARIVAAYLLTQQPAQEPVGEVQHYAAPANLPAYVNMKWYGKPPNNGTKLYANPPTQEPVKQESWISAKERLPESKEMVISARKKRDGTWGLDLNYWTVSNQYAYEYTYWMPLPLPPVEVKE